jgi:hypothetical protein
MCLWYVHNNFFIALKMQVEKKLLNEFKKKAGLILPLFQNGWLLDKYRTIEFDQSNENFFISIKRVKHIVFLSFNCNIHTKSSVILHSVFTKMHLSNLKSFQFLFYSILLISFRMTDIAKRGQLFWRVLVVTNKNLHNLFFSFC